MRIPIFDSETAPTKETGQSLTIPGQRQVAFEVPKTKEVADLAMARVGDTLVDIAVQIREANDVDELNKLKSKTLEGYTAATEEIQNPEFQKNNPREEGEGTMEYYERHRNSRAAVIKEKVLGDFNGSARARKRAETIVSDYDSYNTATIASFSRAKKIEEMEFSLASSMDTNAQAAITSYSNGDIHTYGEAIKNARTAIESNIAAGIVSGPRGEAMLKAFEKDVAVGVQSSELDKAYAADLANMSPTSDKPKALQARLDYIDKGDDPYLQDPRVKADMRNLVEAKMASYDVKYEKYMREVREVWEVKLRQNMEKSIDTATELAMEGNTQSFYDLRKKIDREMVSAVKNKVLSASQAQSLGEYYQKEASFSIYGRRIDSAAEAGDKEALGKLMKTFSAKPSEDQDPHLDEPIKRALYNQAANALNHVDRQNSSKDYIAEQEARKLIENSLMNMKKNGIPLPGVDAKIMSAFQNKDKAQSIVNEYNYDLKRMTDIHGPVDKALKGGPTEENQVLKEVDDKVAAGTQLADQIKLAEEKGDTEAANKLRKSANVYNDALAQQEVRAAIGAKREALKKDSLSYVVETFNTKTMTPVKDIQEGKPYDVYLSADLKQRQRDVGVAENDLRVITKQEADVVASYLRDAKAEEGMKFLASLRNYYGDDWEIANRNLVKSKLPNEYHVALGLPLKDGILLVNTTRADKQLIATELKYEGEADMNKKIRQQMVEEEGYVKFKQSISRAGGHPDNQKIMKDYDEAVYNLAVGYIRQNKVSVDNAVGSAVERVINDNYKFSKQGYRIPAGLNKDVVERNTINIKLFLNEDDLYDAGNTYRNKEEKQMAVSRLQRNGYFANADDDSGLILYSSDGYAATWGPDRKPRVYTWQELNTVDKSTYKEKLERMSRGTN